MEKTVLVDGDIIAYRCAASVLSSKKKPDEDPPELAIRRADELLFRIANTTQATNVHIFVSGSENFRYELFPDYKQNRRDIIRPPMLEPVKEFLCNEWESSVTNGYEADDAISIQHSLSLGNSIIASIDKDFRQLQGEHYNFVSDEFFYINEEEAAWNFWTQMLTGDSSDNVPGIHRCGPVSAAKLLAGIDFRDYEAKVREAYADERRFNRNYYLLRLLRSEEELEDIKRKIQGKEFAEEGS